LKLADQDNNITSGNSFQTTYEELKPEAVTPAKALYVKGFQTTYEELKPDSRKALITASLAFRLPMRN